MDTVVKQQDEQVKDKSEHGHNHKHCHDRRREDHESRHIRELEKSIREVADALAHLGRGEPLHELLHIIHRPGWTTEAELAFVIAILRRAGMNATTNEPCRPCRGAELHVGTGAGRAAEHAVRSLAGPRAVPMRIVVQYGPSTLLRVALEAA